LPVGPALWLVELKVSLGIVMNRKPNVTFGANQKIVKAAWHTGKVGKHRLVSRASRVNIFVPI
jgi:hypothetical protein